MNAIVHLTKKIHICMQHYTYKPTFKNSCARFLKVIFLRFMLKYLRIFFKIIQRGRELGGVDST